MDDLIILDHLTLTSDFAAQHGFGQRPYGAVVIDADGDPFTFLTSDLSLHTATVEAIEAHKLRALSERGYRLLHEGHPRDWQVDLAQQQNDREGAEMLAALAAGAVAAGQMFDEVDGDEGLMCSDRLVRANPMARAASNAMWLVNETESTNEPFADLLLRAAESYNVDTAALFMLEWGLAFIRENEALIQATSVRIREVGFAPRAEFDDVLQPSRAELELVVEDLLPFRELIEAIVDDR